ncbi:hypothetical protein HU200_048277 [Digitaria exilis]|uniref:Protein kinase domain-containing protein n=1 Tax=Digitaria exilis TaxID=1010633 RepID=A0A835E7Z8_9POAL|nr:hypothetical protein HU200_048277 [Digitaria exilis]
MDREDAEEGSAPKRRKRSHHRRVDPGEAAGAEEEEVRVGTAPLASGEPGELTIALGGGAATVDVGRALAPAPEPDNNFDSNLERSPQLQRMKEENHKDAVLKNPKAREKSAEKFEQLVAKLGGNDPEKHNAEARKRGDVTLKKYREMPLEKRHQGIVCCRNNEGTSGNQKTMGISGHGEGILMNERSEDIFVNDIFGESPIGAQGLGKKHGFHIKENAHCDNWDDPGGYYTYRCGEVLHGRYEIIAGHGMGVFSNVVRAKDLKARKGDSDEVAIKILRNIPAIYKAGKQEISILEKLGSANPKDRRHCVRFISSFMYRKHLCLIFESLHMNLRELLKKFGSDVGLKLTAVRMYSKQLFIALKHLKSCNILHCDIKLDNVGMDIVEAEQQKQELPNDDDEVPDVEMEIVEPEEVQEDAPAVADDDNKASPPQAKPREVSPLPPLACSNGGLAQAAGARSTTATATPMNADACATVCQRSPPAGTHDAPEHVRVSGGAPKSAAAAAVHAATIEPATRRDVSVTDDHHNVSAATGREATGPSQARAPPKATGKRVLPK